MLLPDNIHPKNSIYYNSAFVLVPLQRGDVFSLLDLYQEVREKHELSFPLFILCLDWLFLLDVISINSNDEIALCS